MESGKMTIAMLPEISGLSFGEFLNRLAGNPPLQVTTFLVLGTILVNGATDAPNAIASLVASGGMELKKAIRMAAFFNFAGLALMASWNANVAFTIYHMVDFGGDPEKALTALCAALAAIILWASAAWCFGIPTSESHALIAGLTGAAISIHKGLAGIHWEEWIKVVYGLFFSGILGLGMGFAGGKYLLLSGKRNGRRAEYGEAKKLQGIASDAAAAVCLLFASWIGIPVSTTHVKTTSIMGVGLATDAEAVDMAVIKEMLLAWVITFPCCGLIGYITAEWFGKLV